MVMFTSRKVKTQDQFEFTTFLIWRNTSLVLIDICGFLFLWSLFSEEDKFSFLFDSAIDPDNLDNASIELADEVNKTYVTLEELRLLTEGTSPDYFSFFHVNCRSLQSKLSDLQILLKSCDPRIIALTETWLNKDSAESVMLREYEFIYKCREGKRGGGIGLFLDRRIRFENLDVGFKNLAVTTFEFLFVSIECEKAKDLVIGVIYKHPNIDIRIFTRELGQLLAVLNYKNRNIFLMGDFNINIINQNTNTSDFINMLASHFLLPVFSAPTRKGLTNSSCIDNIYTNHSFHHSMRKIVLDDISDHLPLFLSLNLSSAIELRNGSVKQFRRPRSDCNFDELLSEVDWSAVIGSLDEDRNDVTTAYQSFITRFQQIYNYCFPISLQNSRSRTPRKEWMTAGLLKACRKKNFLYRKFIKNPTN